MIANLYSSNVLFSKRKERLSSYYDLLIEYFEQYLESSKTDAFTVRFYREYYNGFVTRSNIGDRQAHGGIGREFINHPQIEEELGGTYISFKVRDTDKSIIESELKKMIATILHYNDQYNCIAQVLEGSGQHASGSALILNAFKIFQSDYLTSSSMSISGGGAPINYQPMTLTALELYNAIYNNIDSFKDFYEQNSDIYLLPSYALKGGNNLKMRLLYETYFNTIIAILGYVSPS